MPTTTEKAIIRKEKHLDEEASADEEVIYKIEVPANRYDLLCLEGLARSLRIFLQMEQAPVFRLAPLGTSAPLRMTVSSETALIRPYVVCAVLRGVTFDEVRYNSFIELQDRLHQNLCRKRTLVAIGTHDLDTLEAPFTYEALPPTDIKFVPLKQADNKLKKFLPIISDSPVFPVLYDAQSKGAALRLRGDAASCGAGSAGSASAKADVAIAYGYNNLAKTVPQSATTGKQQPLNQFCDHLRAEVAQAGFTEVLTWALISHAENFEMVKRVDDKATAAIIGNPRSADFEVVRSSLLPGMLKTMGHNKDAPRPLKIFEVSDVVLLDDSKDVGAANSRRLVALYCNLTSGFESPEFFSGRQADIIFRGKKIGTFGVVHPEILARFDIPDPCSAVELEVEHFL
eukprot:jgi/Mesen1/7619/ME000004S07890